jgi:LysM domain-containing protein
MARREDFTDAERSRVRELKAKGYTGNGIKVRLRIEREENYKQQVQQVNELYRQKLAQGMTPAQAATSQGFNPAGGAAPTQYTIRDGQSLDQIASAHNIQVSDLLDANPEMKTPQTGMVLNVPSYDYQGERNRTKLNAYLSTYLYPFYIANQAKNKTYIFGIPFDWNLDNVDRPYQAPPPRPQFTGYVSPGGQSDLKDPYPPWYEINPFAPAGTYNPKKWLPWLK